MATWISALVVEDDALIRFGLAQSLEAEGFKTYEAADASEAIAVMEANADIRVVFTDIQMPGSMDGLQLSHYVRNRWPPTIIVVSSGRCTPAKDEMASGAFFMAKPYVPSVFNDILRAVRQQIA